MRISVIPCVSDSVENDKQETCMENLINILNQSFPLQKKSAEEFEKIKVRGMNFTIQRYYAKGIKKAKTSLGDFRLTYH